MCRTGRTERFWLVGLNSWGSGCSRAKMPGVFTSTRNFHYWIQRTMRNPPEIVTEPPTSRPPTTRPWSTRKPRWQMPTRTYSWRPPEIAHLPENVMYYRPEPPTRPRPVIITQTFQNWNGEIGVIYRLSKPRLHLSTPATTRRPWATPNLWTSVWYFPRPQRRSGSEDYNS